MLVGELPVLGEDVGEQAEETVLDVQEAEVGERLGRERRLLDEILELLEAGARLLVHVHDGYVVQRDLVEFGLRSRRHVSQRLPRTHHFDHSSH